MRGPGRPANQYRLHFLCILPLTTFESGFARRPQTSRRACASIAAGAPGDAHSPPTPRNASRAVAPRTLDPRPSKSRCLYCAYGTHALPRATHRRRAPPPPRRHPAPVATQRSRPRRPHRRSRRAPALRPRGLALHVRLLHRAAPPLRRRGLPAHRRRPGLARAPDPPRPCSPTGGSTSPPSRSSPRTSPPTTATPSSSGPPTASKRQVEELVAELAPRPDAPALIRKLPERPPIAPSPTSLRPCRRPDRRLLPRTPSRRSCPAVRGGPRSCPVRAGPGSGRSDGVGRRSSVRTESARSRVAPAAAPPASVQPLAPGRYRVQFTASAELRDKLERLQALLRSSVPGADLAAVIEDAVTEKLERLEARRFGLTKAPRKSLSQTGTKPASRHIPAAVRRAVHERDGGRCRFVDEQGRRCTARHSLEYHHRHPVAMGGDHSPHGNRTRVQSPQSVPGGGRLRSCGHGPASAVEHRLSAGQPGSRRRQSSAGQSSAGRSSAGQSSAGPSSAGPSSAGRQAGDAAGEP